jgi:sugar lactone lactonase YvrE
MNLLKSLFGMSVGKFGTSLLILVALGVSACSSGGGDDTPAAATLTSIAITPASATIDVGATTNFVATGTYSDSSTKTITGNVTWASTASVATISLGVATGVAPGTTSVTASLDGVTSPAASLTVIPVLTGINITSTATIIKAASTSNFTATGTYSDSSTADITGLVTWSSSNLSVATIAATGVSTGAAAGTTTVTASLSGITSNDAPLTVIELASIAITPATGATIIGTAMSNFAAIGTYSNGTTEDLTTQAVWATVDPLTATIGQSTGVATGVAAGATQVTASVGLINATAADLTVIDPAITITGITISPIGPLDIAKGELITLTATGTFSDTTEGDITGSVTWVSDDEAVATVSASGVVSTLSAGPANISATVGAVTSSNSIALTVTDPVLATLAITPASASTTVVDTNQFTVSGTLTDGTVATATDWGTLTWTSSDTGVATINSSGIASGVAVGTTNIMVSSSITGAPIDSDTSVLTVTLKQLGGALQGLPMALGTAPVTTLAGSGVATFADGTGTAASFLAPGGVTTDGTNLYVADTYNHRIRKIVIANGAVTTLAGSSFASFGDGTGTSASFNQPEGITTDGTNLYVADTVNNKIRKIVIASGVVTTLAGSGTLGGQNGTGTAATFSAPRGITVDDSGNLYVADTGNSKIRKIVIATGVVSDFTTGLSGPRGITTDGSSLYVANTGDHTIRGIPIAGGAVTTFSLATFFSPQGITTDGTNLYVSDTENHTIRKIVINTGAVSTIAGTLGTSGAANNATGTLATFNRPIGITTDGISLFVSDSSNHLIRKIN